MTSVTVSLPESLKVFIDEQLATRGYGMLANISGRYFVWRKSTRRTHLEAMLVEGLARGGDDIPLTHAFWKDLKAKAMDLAQKHQGRNNQP